MRLRALLISLSSQAQDFTQYIEVLESAGLKTSEDLLFGASTTDQYNRLDADTISFPTFLYLKEEVARAVGTAGLTADVLHSRLRQTEVKRYRGKTGLPALDELLGGFASCDVIEISGGKGTGKTLLALHIVLQFLVMVPDGTALWIDTFHSFPAERAQAVLAMLDGPGKGTALDRLNVSLCFDVQPAIDVLDDIRQSIDLNMEAPSVSTTRFIVIDSITPLLAPALSSVSAQGHATMQTFTRQLSSLARSYSMTVLATNVTASSQPHNALSAFSTTIAKPALGPTFTFLTDSTLWLAKGADAFPEDITVTKTSKEKIYVAELFRSRNALSRTWSAFKSDGISLFSA